MGATPKQHDPDSREAEHDQLRAEALTSDALAHARSRSILSNSRAAADKKVIGLWRTGAALVVFFQLIYAAEHHFASASTFDATLSLHLTNIAIGVVFFLSSFTPAMPRYWRQLALFVCIALLISTTAICARSTRVEALFVSTLVIVVGAGTLAPWDWGWQAALSIIGMICFYVLGRMRGIVDSDPSMYWLGLMTAVGLAQSNVHLQMKHRRALAHSLADRMRTDQKLTDSEEKFRQIFQQSGDMAVVTNLETGAILEVNNQFVLRSRVVSAPLLDLKLYAIRAYSAASVVMFFMGAALFGAMILLPLYFQVVHKMSTADSGLALIPLVVMSTPGSILSGRALSRTRHYKRVPMAALGCAIAAIAVVAWWPAAPLWLVLCALNARSEVTSVLWHRMALELGWHVCALQSSLSFRKLSRQFCQRRANSVCFRCSACGPGCALRERFTPLGMGTAAGNSQPR